jgi:UDP-sugar transporter A1/2/3
MQASHSDARTKRGRTRRRLVWSVRAATLALTSSASVNGYQLPNLDRSHHRCYSKGYRHSRLILDGPRVGLDRPRQPCRPATTLHLAVASAAASLPLPPLGGNAYMALLAVQFACQPLVTQAYASKSMIKSTYVFLLDLMRALICASSLVLTHSWATATVGWNWQDAAMAAGLPSILYVAQNYCTLQAYQHLPPITFNVLNQTKTLSAALWCFLILGQTLSVLQTGALGILLVAALVMEKILPLPFLPKASASSDPLGKEEEEERQTRWISGVVPVLLSSLLSGLAGALAQKTLQGRQRNSLLFSMELAVCSSLTSATALVLLPTPDHRRLIKEGWWKGWTARTWIPLVLQASGGVLVGLVTKYAGSVRKGFCLILGMFLSGLLQNWYHAQKGGTDGRVRVEQWCGGLLAALSFWMYAQ